MKKCRFYKLFCKIVTNCQHRKMLTKNDKNAQPFGDMEVRQCLSALVSGLSAGSFFWGVANSAFWFGFIAALWSHSSVHSSVRRAGVTDELEG